MSQSEDNFNQRLQELVSDARSHPPKTVKRQIALNKLVMEIQRSGKLAHPQRGMWPAYIYEDLYNEALGQTFIEICQKIENYNPAHPVMAWVNFLLNNRFIDAVRRYQSQQKPLISLDDLDKPIAANEESSEAQRVREFIREDPENRLKSESIQNRPDVTLQRLLWLKDVEDRKWKEIAEELGLGVSTLSTFYQRGLHKVADYFRKYLME